MHTRRLEFPGEVKLVADDCGDVAATPVILMHGGGQTRHAWRTILPAVVGLGLRAISLDLRGHGESDWAADGDYGPARFVEDLDRVIVELGGQAPFLVGASLGGRIGVLYAGGGLRPVRGLALVDYVPQLNQSGTARIGDFMHAHPEGFASVDEAADVVAQYRTNHRRPRSTAGLMKNLRLGEDGRYRWHWDPRFMSGGYGRASVAEMEQAASRLDIPVLLLRGGISDVVTPAGAAAFRAIVPQTEFVEVPGADHMLTGDLNSPYNLAVVDFLKRHM